jgi:uncharacterized protein YgiM (DUF1202 family)
MLTVNRVRTAACVVLFLVTPHMVAGQLNSEQSDYTVIEQQIRLLESVRLQLEDSLTVILNKIDSLRSVVNTLKLSASTDGATLLTTKTGGSMREKPDVFSRELARVESSETVLLLDYADNNYLFVRYRDQDGYIILWSFENDRELEQLYKQAQSQQNQQAQAEIERLIADTRYIKSLTANIRSEPSINSSVVNVVHQGHNIFVQAEEGDWVKIRFHEEPRRLSYPGWTMANIEESFYSGWVSNSLVSNEFVQTISEADIRRRQFINANPGISERQKNNIIEGTVSIGMTREMVIASWGEPGDINRTVTGSSVSEQWVYGTIPNQQYLYFENGLMTTFQD